MSALPFAAGVDQLSLTLPFRRRRVFSVGASGTAAAAVGVAERSPLSALSPRAFKAVTL